jgi:hypothetical protein
MKALLALQVMSACLVGGTLLQEPDDPDALFARAEELACAGRHVDARALYKRIARAYPETPAGKRARARTEPSAFLAACPLVDHGPAANRVDLVILGDGYEADHLRAFDELADDVPPLFERVEPFREYWSYFNVLRGVCVSADAGVDGFGRDYDTLFGGYTLATDAGHVGIDARRVRAVLEQIPGSDELAVVFVKLGVAGTGSPGTAVIGGRDARTTIHEFGHAFAQLGDEYSTRTHDRGAVRDSINVSSTDDEERVPWRHWLAARHPSVGVYEGAAGRPQDAWRPTASGCVMNDGEAFCPVCREALVLRIYSIVDPIDAVDPPAPPPGIREPLVFSGDALEIEVRTMRPASHDLEVSWWLEDARRYPITPTEPGQTTVAQTLSADRRFRRPLTPRQDPPTQHGRTGKDALSTLRLSRSELEPGQYRVTCRVRDPTQLRGEKFPWVLADDKNVLESERVWWVDVR